MSNTDALASSMISLVHPQNPTYWPRHVQYIDLTCHASSILSYCCATPVHLNPQMGQENF